MEVPPKYNFFDVVWAPARALSAKQIGVMTIALVAALALYNIFTYIAYAAQGEELGIIFSAYGFFPFELGAFNSAVGQIIYYIGVVIAIFALMFGFFGVAAINIETMRGHRFFSLVDALKFSRSRAKQIVLAELAILTFILFIIAVFVLLGLIARIPRIGEWLYAVLFFFPNFFIALFAVFAVFIVPVTIFLLPVVAAAERKGETFGVILEVFSTLIRTPMRWATWSAYTLVVAKLASFVYAYFCYRAVQFLTFTTSLAGGHEPEWLVRAGLYHLPVRTDLAEQMTNVFPGIHWSFQIPYYPVLGAYQPAAYVMTIMLFFIFASVVGYFLAVLAAGQTSIYVALRYVKDSHRIPDEEPMFGKHEAEAGKKL